MMLNTQEQQEITKLLNNDVLLKAIEKVILQPIYTHGTLVGGEEAYPLQNFALHTRDAAGKEFSNEELGELTKAKRIAIDLLVSGVENLAKHKIVDIKKTTKKNPGR